MNTSIITVKTDFQTKQTAQAMARELGLSLSGVLNALVKQFVRTKRLEIALDNLELEPTNYLKKAIVKSETERKAGNIYSFNNPHSALEFLDEVIDGKK